MTRQTPAASAKPLELRFPRLYRKLKSLHGTAKAIEILLDGTRKVPYTLGWIRAVRRLSP